MSIDHWMRKVAPGGAAAAKSPGAPAATQHGQPATADCSIPGVRPDLTGLHHWADPAAKPPAKKLDPVAQVQENLKDLEATRHAQALARARDGVDNKQARYEFLNTLDQVADPDMRHRMMAKFSEATGQSLEAFIRTADWDGGRDKEEALRLISPERDAAAEKIKAMSPGERKQLEGKANDWAQRVLAVTRIEDADSDTAAADIFRALGPRSPEEVEMIRAAVRRNTGGHGIYEELDRSLSGNTQDEAVAGLSGDPVHAAWVGLKNVDDNPGRSIEILRGLTPAQRQELISKKAILGTGWIVNGIPEGADREEVRLLLANDTAGADGEHLANLLRDPDDGAQFELQSGSAHKTAQTKKFEAARATSNVIKEFESKSPEQLLAAKEAFNKRAAERGGPSWDEMLEARFKDGDPTTYMRMQALSRGDRAESKALGFRLALEAGNQPELERVLASPDLTSDDPIKRAAAEQERNELASKIEAFDAQQKYAQAVLRGENPGEKQFAGREVTEQIEQHFADEAASNVDKARVDQMRDAASNGFVLADGLDTHLAKRNETTRDNKYAAEEVWKDGKVAASTEVRRAEKDKNTEKKLGMLENLKSNEELAGIGADYQRKYGKDMLASPDQSAFYAKAAFKKSQGDPRPLNEILSDVARNELDANQLRLEHLREYGTKADRRPDVQLKLQHELYDKQFSEDLDEQELVRASHGGNFGTQDLARNQLAAQEEMLEEKHDPFGILPRDLKPGVDREQYDQIDRNLTSTLEVQREEKVKLAEKNTRIFTVIAMIGSIAIANPALALAFNAALQATKMKMKRDIAGEAYDDSGDAAELFTNLGMDGAMVGAALFTTLVKGARGIDAASDAARIGEHSATQLAEHAVTTEAREEVVEQAVKQVAPDAAAIEKQAAHAAEAKAGAGTATHAEDLEKQVAAAGESAATKSDAVHIGAVDAHVSSVGTNAELGSAGSGTAGQASVVSSAAAKERERVLEVFTGPDLESTRALKGQHPDAQLVAAEKSFPPKLEERAKFEAEGHKFLEEKFAESLPAGSVDHAYVRYPLPHTKGVENVRGPDVLEAIAEEMRLNPALDQLEAANRAISKLEGGVESVQNLGPHMLEKLKPDGTLDVVLHEEKEIMREVEALTKRVHVDPATGDKFQFAIATGPQKIPRSSVGAEGFGVSKEVKVVTQVILRKVPAK